MKLKTSRRWAIALLAPLLLGLTLLLCGAAARAQTGKHPRLLFDAKDLPTLRRNLAGPLKPVAVALRGAVEAPYQEGSEFPRTPDVKNKLMRQDIRGMADTLASFAFAATVFRDGGVDQIFPELPADKRTELADRAKTLAHDFLVGVCQPDFPDWLFPDFQEGTTPDLPMAHFLFDVALAYDWLYPILTEAERDLCRARIARHAPQMYKATQDDNTWWVHEYMQNHFWLNHAGLGMAALAFEGELPGGVDTTPWLMATNRAMKMVQTVLDPIQGGAWHEGIGYSNYGMLALLPFSLANQKLKGGTDYADAGFVRDYPIFRLYGMPPGIAHRREFIIYGDFSNFQNDDTLAVARYVARKKRDGRAAWYADAFTEGQRQGRGGLTTWAPGQRGIILSAILYDATVKPVAPPAGNAAWDLDYYASDLAIMTARSGWGDDASLLSFKTGVYGGHAAWNRAKNKTLPKEELNFGHNHADDMSLSFYALGECLTTTVPAYYIGRGNLIQGNRTEYANSLLIDCFGQILEGPRSGIPSTPDFFERISSIPVRGSTAHYTFLVGDGAKLYDRKFGLQTFDRTILFVDRRLPIVRDVIRGTTPHRYEIAYHAIDEASQEGDWLRLQAKNGRLLGIKIVAPTNAVTRTVTQTAANLRSFDADNAMTAVFLRPPPMDRTLRF